MLQYFENLRKKPQAHRRRAVFFISLYTTLVIAIVWVIITSVRLAHTDFSSHTNGLNGAVPTLGDTLGKFIDRAGEIIKPVQTSTTSTPEQ